MNQQFINESVEKISSIVDEIATQLLDESETYAEAIEKLIDLELDNRRLHKMIYSKIHQRMVKEKPTKL